VTTSVSSILTGILALALQTPTPTPAVSPKPAAPPPVSAPQGAASAAAKPGAIVLTISNEKGEPLSGASVSVRGAVDRAGTSGSDGTVTLQNIPVGTVRCRITRDGYITLEKEIAVKAAARSTAEAVLSAAPPPPPPPPAPTPTPEVRPAPPMGEPGVPATANIATLADQMLNESQPSGQRILGCSGVMKSTLLVAKDNTVFRGSGDVDEIVYVLGGDATLTIGDKDQNIGSGWFGLVPRGTTHSVTRRGRSPIALFIVQSGKPCGK
jgi:mannose-6-phosphate isomerase-like protein (cupin superfamily)